MKKSLNILVCPLEWGLGHAARMVPLVMRLRKDGHNVIIGGGRETAAFYNREIPGLQNIRFPGFKPRYSKHLPQYAAILVQIPVLAYYSLSEHNRLKKIIQANNTDIVISDNRLGLWNKKIRTIYITHQIRIPFPKAFRFLEFIGIMIHRAVIRQYDHCFIPDLPGDNNLSGRLSHGIRLPANTSYIGILSRFGVYEEDQGSPVSGTMHNTVILSGPEPQRTILEKKLQKIFIAQDKETVFLRGLPAEEERTATTGRIVMKNHLPASEMKKLITNSEIIVTRSGYTTVMELASMKRTALLIPAPGQTEQEYISDYLNRKGWFTGIAQNKIRETLPCLKASPVPYDEIISESRKLLNSALRIFSEDNQQR